MFIEYLAKRANTLDIILYIIHFTISAFKFNDPSHLSPSLRWSRGILSWYICIYIMKTDNIFHHFKRSRVLPFTILFARRLTSILNLKPQFRLVWLCDGFFSTWVVGVSRFNVGFSFWNDPALAQPILFFPVAPLVSRSQQAMSALPFKVTRPSCVCPRFVSHFYENYRMPFEHHMFRCRPQFDEDGNRIIDESYEITVIRYRFHGPKHIWT